MSILAKTGVFLENVFGTGLDIYWYGALITFAVVFGVFLASTDCKRKGFKSDLATDIVIVVMICAIIGARAYYIIFDPDDYFRTADFGEFLRRAVDLRSGGLAIYGGVIGGAFGLWLIALFSKKKYSFLKLADLCVPSLAIGQAIGRWGNFCNQEAFGFPVTDTKLQFFPYAVYFENPKGASAGWFQATFFYESLWCVLLGIFLFWFFKKQKYNGQITLLYFTLYGVERALVELLRQDQLILAGMPVSTLLSAAMVILCGSALLILHLKHYSSEVPRAELEKGWFVAWIKSGFCKKADNAVTKEESTDTKENNNA